MRNRDELYVVDIANRIPGVIARLGTPEEDCGYHKADVVMMYNNSNYYVQVSYTPKSKREKKKLLKRGTYPVHTHKFTDMPLGDRVVQQNLESILPL